MPLGDRGRWISVSSRLVQDSQDGHTENPCLEETNK